MDLNYALCKTGSTTTAAVGMGMVVAWYVLTAMLVKAPESDPNQPGWVSNAMSRHFLFLPFFTSVVTCY